jgi:hypothetical protein
MAWVRARHISAFAIAIAVALLISAIFDVWQKYAVRDATLSGDPLLHVVQDERVSARLQYIDGSTAVPATVSLISQGKVLEQVRTGTSASPGTQFGFDLRPFSSAYGFTVEARAHQGPFLLYDDRSVELAPASGRTVAPRTFKRELWLHVSYDRLRYYVRLTFARDDPFAGAFVAGGMPLGTFLSFTLPQFSGAAPVDLSAFAIPGSQSVVVTPALVTVRLSGDSNLIGAESIPIGDEVRLTMRHGEYEAFDERPRPDTIHMLVDGYRIREQSPLPAQRSANGYATWYPSARTEESDIVAMVEPAVPPGLGKVRRDIATVERGGGLPAALRVVLGGAFNLAPPLIALFILAPTGEVDPARRRLISTLLTAIVAYPSAYGAYRTLGAVLAVASGGDASLSDATAYGAASIVLLALWMLILRVLPGGPDVPSAAATMITGLLAAVGADALQDWFSPYSPGSFALGTVLSVVILMVFLRPELLRHCVVQTWPSAEPWAIGAGVVAIVSVALTVPIHTPTTALGVHLVDTVLTTEFGAGRLATAAIIMPVLLTGLHFAAKRADWKWQDKPYSIAALWAAYAIGTTPGVFTIPLALALGVVTFRCIALAGRRQRACIETTRAEIAEHKETRAEDFATMRETMRTRETIADLEDRISAGAIKPEEYEQSHAALTARLAKLEGKLVYSSDVRLSDIAFGFGADPDPWQNGIAAAIAGFVIALVLVAAGTPVLRSSVPLFSTVTGIVGIVAAHVAAAFLFGYFFAYVRGTMGVTKALAFSAAALTATLPVSLLVASRATMISEAVSLVIFYGLIGAWFDVHGWRSAGVRPTLGEAFSLGGLGNFAAVGTFAVTALLTGLSGQLQQVVPLLFKAVEAQFKIGQ